MPEVNTNPVIINALSALMGSTHLQKTKLNVVNALKMQFVRRDSRLLLIQDTGGRMSIQLRYSHVSTLMLALVAMKLSVLRGTVVIYVNHV